MGQVAWFIYSTAYYKMASLSCISYSSLFREVHSTTVSVSPVLPIDNHILAGKLVTVNSKVPKLMINARPTEGICFLCVWSREV